MNKCDCGKDAFPSIHAARDQCRNMGNRFRVYPCPYSGTYHVTKASRGDSINTERSKRIKRKAFRHGE